MAGSRLAFWLVLPVVLYAQTNTGVIRGIVTDPDGAVVAGARVSAADRETGEQYPASTNEAGLYSIPEVPAGAYTVTAEHAGFRRSVRQGVTLTTGQTLALDIKREVGELGQSITVTAEASQLETATSGIDRLIESQSIADLPLADRRTMNVI